MKTSLPITRRPENEYKRKAALTKLTGCHTTAVSAFLELFTRSVNKTRNSISDSFVM